MGGGAISFSFPFRLRVRRLIICLSHLNVCTLALLQETMKLMGMKPSAYWTSWFLSSWLSLLVLIVIITAILSYPFFEGGAILIHSDGTLIFCLLFVYSFALVTFFLMVSTFTDNGETTRAGPRLSLLLQRVPCCSLSDHSVVLC